MKKEHSTIICKELNLKKDQVNSTLRLLKEGCTIPFIARYRKESTGSLNELVIREIKLRDEQLTVIDQRKDYILNSIENQGKLTSELRERIELSTDVSEIEDLYFPFRQKRKTKASVAREQGLEPLAKIIMSQNTGDIKKLSKRYVNGSISSIEKVIAGASDIIAEWISDSEKARSVVRGQYYRSAIISSKVIKGKEVDGQNYRLYFDFSESLRTISPHRYLAIRRGESEGFLKISMSIDDGEICKRLNKIFIRNYASQESTEIISKAIKDSYRRLIRPSIETEISSKVKERSDEVAISIFAENVRQLLMAPPLSRKRIMALDPGYRTGSKLVCLDEQGSLLYHDVIYPCSPKNDIRGASNTICHLVDKYSVDMIVVGNGTAGRDTERFLHSITYPRKIEIQIVSEQGASEYSASDIAIEEFPYEDITVRGAVSIGRRVLDPLAELVKIEPKHIGVGQYQHDVNQTKLKESLDFTVESCVNTVGVNVNTASKALLSYVSGIGKQLAANIIEYRSLHGPFISRDALKKVPRMGERAFQQCAGFLRIPNSTNPLDNTSVHPERYELVKQIAEDLDIDLYRLLKDNKILHRIDLNKYLSDDIGLPTLNDIVMEIEKPGRDPRDKIEDIIFDEKIKVIDDIHAGMELTGRVNNITGFGVFVDLGIKENGLVHISQLSNKYITSASDVVSIGQKIRVKVIDVDTIRGRIALSLKDVLQR